MNREGNGQQGARGARGRRSGLLAVLGASMLLTGGCATMSPTKEPPPPSPLRGVVRVATPEGFGSGFFVTPHLVVTAAHVLGTHALAVVQAAGGLPRPAAAVHVDPRLDVALLVVREPGTPLPVRVTPLLDGEPVAAVGYPQGRATLALQTGTVRAILPAVLEHDALIAPGSSGGPLLDAAGQVVGINAALVQERSGYQHFFAVKMAAVLAALRAAHAG